MEVIFTKGCGDDLTRDKAYNVEGRCKGCNYVRIVWAGNWSFPGCCHKPYRGKWCAEIEECPIQYQPKEEKTEDVF